MKRSCCRYRTSLAGCVSALFLAVAADAATVTVTSTADAGGTCPGANCTLRQAIATAVSGDTINFSLPAHSAITLTNGELLINEKSLTINGPGANLLTVQRSAANGTAQFRIFEIAGGSFVTIAGLKIANGSVFAVGGGIYNNGGSVLYLTSVTISGNMAAGGGGIYNDSGQVTIANSTISGNFSGTGGGGIYHTNPNLVEGFGFDLQIENSTISGNTTSSVGAGGGIYILEGQGGFRSSAIYNSTISGNSAGNGAGGGVFDNTETMYIRNTIIAGNTATSGGPDFQGSFSSSGFNLIGNNSGANITAATGDQIGIPASSIDPMLGPLQDNGGSTPTHALLAGSKAIDKGSAGTNSTDQRGFPRPIDTPAITNAGDGSDIGAYEVQPDQLVGCSDISLLVNNTGDGGAGSLRAVIANACAGSTITFAVGGTINLTSGELLISKSLTINGPGANLLKVQRSVAPGNSGGGILNEENTLTLSNCVLSGNKSSLHGGAILNYRGAVNLARCTLDQNSAAASGGAILNADYDGGAANEANLTLTNCTLNQNQAGQYGGTIYNDGTSSGYATVTLTNCTLNQNTAALLAGGIYNDALNPGSSGIASVSLKNTILRADASGANLVNDNGTISSGGHNLSSDAAGGPAGTGPGGFLNGPGDIRNTDPQLNPGGAANNGGSVTTVALLAASPAINGSDPSAPPRDQRGYIRPDAPDVGAFEFGGTIPNALGNISTRGFVGTGNNVLIEGLIISGGGPKKVILRALGPTLGQPPFNVPGALQNPVLELYNSSSALITSNDNWGSAANAATISSSGYAPPNSLESAILTNLNPGNYTAIVRGANNTTGVALVEGYDLDFTAGSKLGNISTRGFVQTGNNVMIAGVIVHGPDSENVIIRGLGPTLGQPPFNVPNALQNPFLDLRDANGNPIMTNDNWKSTQQAQIQATGFAPPNDAESAILMTLSPGNYTAILRGVNNTTGNALVEVYALN